MQFGLAKVTGHSMIPALAPGELVLVGYGAKFAVGDIVLAQGDERIDIKRIDRLEGNLVYLVGDNAEVSLDSRQSGPVEKNKVVGKVLYRLPKFFNRN